MPIYKEEKARKPVSTITMSDKGFKRTVKKAEHKAKKIITKVKKSKAK